MSALQFVHVSWLPARTRIALRLQLSMWLLQGAITEFLILTWCCKAYKTKVASELRSDYACRFLDPMSSCIPAATLWVLTKQ